MRHGEDGADMHIATEDDQRTSGGVREPEEQVEKASDLFMVLGVLSVISYVVTITDDRQPFHEVDNKAAKVHDGNE